MSTLILYIITTVTGKIKVCVKFISFCMRVFSPTAQKVNKTSSISWGLGLTIHHMEIKSSEISAECLRRPLKILHPTQTCDLRIRSENILIYSLY